MLQAATVRKRPAWGRGAVAGPHRGYEKIAGIGETWIGRAMKKTTKTAVTPLAGAAAPRALTVKLTTKKGETHGQALARHTLAPAMQAGMTLAILNGEHPEADVMAFVDELRAQGQSLATGDLARGETMLSA